MNQQILVNTLATITAQFFDQNGSAVAPAGVVTVDIVDGAASAVVTDAAASVDETTNVVSYVLAIANNSSLNLLTATWADEDGRKVVTQIEVVGGFYFTIAEVRLLDQTLNDSGDYPDEDIIRARHEVETVFEMVCNFRSFVPRYRRVVLDGPGSFRLELPNPGVTKIRSLSNYGTALTQEQIDFMKIDDYGIVSYLAGSFSGGESVVSGSFFNAPGSVVVEYEYGLMTPPPDVKSQADTYLRHVLLRTKSGIDPHATAFSSGDGGTYSLALAGTGIPEVDNVLDRYRSMVPSVA